MRKPRVLVVTPHPGRRCTFRVRPARRGEFCEAIVPESSYAAEHRCEIRFGIEKSGDKYLCKRHRRPK